VRRRTTAVLVAGILALARAVGAAGPLLVNGAGVPLAWRTDAVPFNPDRGPLGKLSNRAAVRLVTGNFAVWAAVPSASIRFRNAGPLPIDARLRNYQALVGACDGVSPIIFDQDGRVTDDLLGVGARNEVLGFATPECGDVAGGTITESIAVLNGRWIDGIASRDNPEISVDDFAAVFVHEFGHFFNLDHSQIGLAEAFDDDPSNDDAVATMFPFLANGAEARTLAVDDEASVSALYPGPAAAAMGGITGRVLRGDGTPFQGAYVIARNVADPRRTAVGYTSGARYVPDVDGTPNPGGPPPKELVGAFELSGLPPGTYTVEVQAIDPRFSGGSGVGPLDPPVALPGPPEFWSGADESDASPPDDPADAAPITVEAGATVAGIDVRLNDAPPSNDACAAAVPIERVPFVDVRSVRTATTAADDPLQSCSARGPAQNRGSVWYRLVVPETGRLVVDTTASTYDTVLTAHAGLCGALVQRACSDDRPTGVTSRLDLDVTAGTVLLLEVTAFRDVLPGTLGLAVHRGCLGAGVCDDGDPCTTGDVCTDGVCAGPVAACDDGNPCTRDACDAASGDCRHAAAAGSCDDGDPCSIGDVCADGACVAGSRIGPASLVRTLRARPPAACTGGVPILERTAARRLANAAHALRRLDAGARVVGRAFARAGRELRAARHAAAHLLVRGGGPCGVALLERVRIARAQLACVRDDLAPHSR
jgi:slime mold repeat-containing protein